MKSKLSVIIRIILVLVFLLPAVGGEGGRTRRWPRRRRKEIRII